MALKRPVTSHRRSRASWWPWGWVLLGEIVSGTVAVLAIGWFVLYYSPLILPGVQTLGIGLGGMSKADAIVALQADWQQRTIVLQAGTTVLTTTPTLLGITLDANATADLAYQQGRARLLSARLTPVLQIDAPTAQAALQSFAPQIDQAPVNAGVQIANGRAEATAPVAGRRLDITATLAYVEQYLVYVTTQGRVNLVTTPVQPAITDMSAIAEQVNHLLISPLSFRAYDPINNQSTTWTAAPETWSAWLALYISPDAQAQWQVIPEKLQPFLAAQSAALGPGRYVKLDEAAAAIENALAARQPNVTVRVYHYPQQHSVQAGETISSIGRAYGIPYAWVEQANPGISDQLHVGQTLVIPSPDVMLPLPIVENKRIVISITDQRMWAYENGLVKWEWPVSTGIASSYTSPGVFQIQSHERKAYAGNWNLWMPYFMGIYRPVPTSQFMNGFHGFPSRGGSQILWTSNLGRPITYGCILISTENAALLYDWAEEGVIVEIQP